VCFEKLGYRLLTIYYGNLLLVYFRST